MVLGLLPWWKAHREAEHATHRRAVARDTVRNTIVRWQARALALGIACAWVGQAIFISTRRTWPEARRPFLLALSVLVLYGLAVALWPVHSSDPLRTLSYATIALAVAALVWQWSDDPATAGGKRLVMAAGAILPLIALMFVREFRFEEGIAAAGYALGRSYVKGTLASGARPRIIHS